MPKGIHDSSSDGSLINGYEMQIRIHADEGYSGDRHLKEGKGLMINTVEKASFGGLPFFQQRIQLTDGTIINARLSYGVQQVDIFPVSGGEDISKGLFVLRPEAGYPKVVIYLDKNKPDGIGLKWGDNIEAGNFHCQDIQKNRMLLSIKMTDAPAFVEGATGSSLAQNYVYAGGYTLLLATDAVIGAAIVDDSIFCFVINDDSYIRFYSHPLISINYSNPDYTTPLINFSSCTLVHSILFKSYNLLNKITTVCTFNLSGTSARVGALRGEETISADTKAKQDIWDITLSESSGVLNVSDSYQAKEHSFYVKSVNNDALQIPSIPDSTGYVGNMSYRIEYTSYYEEYMVWDQDEIYDDKDVFFGTIMSRNGSLINPTYTKEDYTHQTGTINELTTVGISNREAFILISTLSHESQAELDEYIDTVIHQIDLHSSDGRFIGQADAPSITSHVYARGREGGLNKDDYRKEVHNFGWGRDIDVEYYFKSDAQHDDWLRYANISGTPPYLMQYSTHSETSGDPPSTVWVLDIDPPHPVYNERNEIISGTSEKHKEYLYLSEFNSRAGVAIYAHRKEPSKISPLIFDSPRSSSVWDDLQPDTNWGDPDFTIHGDCYITFETPRGSIDVPGLYSRHENVDDDIDSVYNAPKYVVSPEGTSNGPDIKNHGPYLANTKAKSMMLSHEEGYTLYSMTDYFVHENEDSYNAAVPVKTVLTLYDHDRDKHIDILKRYNDLLITDDRTNHLDTLEVSRTGNPAHYIESAGVINKITKPILII